MFRIAKFVLVGLWFSSVAFAEDDDWGGHHRHHHGHHRHYHGHEYYPAYPVERVYVPERVVEYVPMPQPYYAPPPPRYQYYDQRSPQGLVGGLVGSAMGYELGRGDPLAAGIGAAAGSWIGNGMNR